MEHGEETRLAQRGGTRAAISMPDRPGLRRRARRRTSRPAYRRAGGFHDGARLTDEGRTRVAMMRMRQCRATTRRQGVSQRIPVRRGHDRWPRRRCARDDFLTFSLYHLKIASNFQVPMTTSIRRKPDEKKRHRSRGSMPCCALHRCSTLRAGGPCRTCSAALPHPCGPCSTMRERGFDERLQ